MVPVTPPLNVMTREAKVPEIVLQGNYHFSIKLVKSLVWIFALILQFWSLLSIHRTNCQSRNQPKLHLYPKSRFPVSLYRNHSFDLYHPQMCWWCLCCPFGLWNLHYSRSRRHRRNWRWRLCRFIGRFRNKWTFFSRYLRHEYRPTR